MSKTLCDLVVEFTDKPPGKVRGVVIHLRRAVERRPLVRKLIDAVGPLEVWGAVDGAQLLAEGHPTECGIDPGVVRTAGEVGCVASHISAYKRALQEGVSHLVVFEDDCVVAPGFSLEGIQAYLQRAKKFAAEFGMKGMDDFLLLGTCGCYEWKDLTEGLKATNHFNGSHAYIIGREMMIMLIHSHLQFLGRNKTAPIDGLLPILLQSEGKHAFCPENDTEFFKQNREIPSYIVSDGAESRKD
jgi:GR25 family glycosyltransferase involved in LPS biosynthesis